MALPRAWCGGCCRRPSSAHMYLPIFVVNLVIAVSVPGLFTLESSYFSTSEGFLVRGISSAIVGLLTFFSTPLFAALSDAIGRRGVLSVTVAAACLPYAAIAATSDLWWYYGAQIATAAFGSSTSIALAYIADCTTHEERLTMYGRLLGAVSVTFVVGTPAGQLLTDTYGPRPVFAALAGVVVLTAVYVVVVVPESLLKAAMSRGRLDWTKLSVLHIWRKLSGGDVVPRLAAIAMFKTFAEQGIMSVIFFYLGARFGFSSSNVTAWTAMMGGISFLVQAGVLPLLTRVASARTLLLMALTCSLAHSLLYAFMTVKWMAFAAVSIYCAASLFEPLLDALLSNHVDPTMQGTVQGAVQGLTSLNAIFGPLLFGYILNKTTKVPGYPVPGLVFIVASALFLISLGMAIFWYRDFKAPVDQHSFVSDDLFDPERALLVGKATVRGSHHHVRTPVAIPRPGLLDGKVPAPQTDNGMVPPPGSVSRSVPSAVSVDPRLVAAGASMAINGP